MAISHSRRQSLPAHKVGYPKSSRVGGKGRNAYPLDTKARARNALARSAQKGTGGTYRTIERKVNRLYPSITTRHHAGR
jgi:hypothetical protein